MVYWLQLTAQTLCISLLCSEVVLRVQCPYFTGSITSDVHTVCSIVYALSVSLGKHSTQQIIVQPEPTNSSMYAHAL